MGFKSIKENIRGRIEKYKEEAPQRELKRELDRQKKDTEREERFEQVQKQK